MLTALTLTSTVSAIASLSLAITVVATSLRPGARHR